jgi:hypothetical protein
LYWKRLAVHLLLRFCYNILRKLLPFSIQRISKHHWLIAGSKGSRAIKKPSKGGESKMASEKAEMQHARLLPAGEKGKPRSMQKSLQRQRQGEETGQTSHLLLGLSISIDKRQKMEFYTS